MSSAEGKNNNGPDEIGGGPTRSFDGSVRGAGEEIGPFRIERELGRGAVVVHRASGSIRSFDFLNVNDYSTAF